MATDSAREERIKEVRDPSYTAGVSEKTPSETILEFVDQEVLDTENPPSVRAGLSPDDYGDIVNDEDLTYQNLYISDTNAARFQPPKITGEPAPDIYVTKDEEFQIRPQDWIDDIDCVCADGRASKGRKNTRTGKIDCDCNTNLSTSPDIYNPEPNTPRYIDKKPLRDQAGVSYFGTAKLEPCKVGSTEAEERAHATLNNVIQEGRTVSSKNYNQPKDEQLNSNTKDSYSIYDKCDYNLYSI